MLPGAYLPYIHSTVLLLLHISTTLAAIETIERARGKINNNLRPLLHLSVLNVYVKLLRHATAVVDAFLPFLFCLYNIIVENVNCSTYLKIEEPIMR